MKRSFMVPILLALGFLLVGCATSAGGDRPGGTGGIEGKVLLGPMCPVQQVNSPCPDKPIEADITVTTSDGKTVATGRSDADGTYRISLPPGSYTVVAKRAGGEFGSGKPVSVDVSGGTFVHVNLVVDSGIR
jgi:carboxypeptidase family protein